MLFSQRRLGDAAKKAIGKLTTRTVRKGDKVTAFVGHIEKTFGSSASVPLLGENKRVMTVN